ncbi:Uncharacterised protein [Vibrio cholerae]|nr:Uncharacterised protein [Vibrio cholerae]
MVNHEELWCNHAETHVVRVMLLWFIPHHLA